MLHTNCNDSGFVGSPHCTVQLILEKCRPLGVSELIPAFGTEIVIVLVTVLLIL